MSDHDRNETTDFMMSRLLNPGKSIEDITPDEWKMLEKYLFALSDLKTPEALQTLVDAMFVYNDDSKEWFELTDELDLNAHLIPVELSEAVIRAQGKQDLQLLLSQALSYGLRETQPIPEAVVENVLKVYLPGNFAPIAWLYDLIGRIVRETQDMRFIQPTLQLLSHEDVYLRLIAVEVLGEYDNGHIAIELTVMLEDSDERVREKAKEVLKQKGFYEE